MLQRDRYNFTPPNFVCNDTGSMSIIPLEFEYLSYRFSYYFLIVLIVAFLAVLPFYVYVNKVNRERDQEMPLFPITHHIYKMVLATYALFFTFVILCVFPLFIRTSSIDETPIDQIPIDQIQIGQVTIIATIGFFLAHIIALFLYINSQVFQVLISLVAIRKFVLYFRPSLASSVMEMQKTFVKYIWSIYVVIGLKELTCLILSIVAAIQRYCTFRDEVSAFEKSYIVFNIVYLLSALLYVPVFISMKMRKSKSLRKNKPQRHIVWQTVVILVFKAISLTITILSILHVIYFTMMFFVFTIILDIVSTPFIVQVSYLCMNKKSVKHLIYNFKFANFMRILMGLEVKSTVVPERGSIQTTGV